MTKIITIRDRAEWTYYVQMAAEFDCYHTWHYNSLEKSGDPIMFVYQQHDDFIAVPLVARPVPGTIYSDLTCVYGFSGPISNKKMDDLDEHLADSFKSAFMIYLQEENYVSVFLRLHPFFEQGNLLERFGGVHDNGRVVVLDLSLSLEEQRQRYSPAVRAQIRKAWNRGFTVKEEKGPEAIDLFISIYMETMQRVDASEYYLFNHEYFHELYESEEYDTRVLIVYDGDEPIAGTMIMFTNGIIQAHLVGTRREYLKYSPTKFLVDEITQIGRRDGMRYMNLGGGLGFKEDSLLQWKLSFTDNTLGFKTWRYIANAPVYQLLLNEKGIDENTGVDFFPLYRYAQIPQLTNSHSL
ncbi:MAG: GNAT family N-acetyltransferase [Mucilaginibacter sp.]